MRRRDIVVSTVPLLAAACNPLPSLPRNRLDPPRSGGFQVGRLPTVSRLEYPYRLSLPRRDIGWFKTVTLRFSRNDENAQTIRFGVPSGFSVGSDTATLAAGETMLEIRLGIARAAAQGPASELTVTTSGGIYERTHRMSIDFYDRDGDWALLGNLDMCGVHAASLSDGRVIFLSYLDRDSVEDKSGKMQLIDADMAPLGDSLIGPATILDDYNPFCAGHCFLGDGRLLLAGGHHHTLLHTVRHGRRVNVFDPRAGGGLAPPPPERRRDMQNDRWYPSCLTLGTGDAMIIGGSAPLPADSFNDVNEDVEWFTLASNEIRAGAPRAPGSLGRKYPRRMGTANREDGRLFQEDGKRLAGLYPLLHLLPVREGDQFPVHGFVFAITEMYARIYDPVSNRLIGTPLDVGGVRTWPTQGSSVLLPIDIDEAGEGPDIVQIMVVGGGTIGRNEHTDPAWANYEILDYDRRSQSLTISASLPLPRRRFMGDSVLLPTGEIAVIGGAARGYTDNNRERMTVVDFLRPTADPLSWTVDAAANARDARGYHASAVLTASGAVIVCGGNEGFKDGGPKGREFLSVERYAPPYMNAGPRPEIEGAPVSAEYGQIIEVDSNEPFLDPWITLVRYSSRTHSLDTDQRMLRLRAIDYDGSPYLRAPADQPQLCPARRLHAVRDPGSRRPKGAEPRSDDRAAIGPGIEGVTRGRPLGTDFTVRSGPRTMEISPSHQSMSAAPFSAPLPRTIGRAEGYL